MNLIFNLLLLSIQVIAQDSRRCYSCGQYCDPNDSDNKEIMCEGPETKWCYAVVKSKSDSNIYIDSRNKLQKNTGVVLKGCRNYFNGVENFDNSTKHCFCDTSGGSKEV